MNQPLDPEMFAACPPLHLPVRTGDKWTAKILRCLEGGRRRFSELQVPLTRSGGGGITPKVLTESLRAMERDGLVIRTAHGGIPPRVDYELTSLGRSLLGPLAAQCEWTRAHLAELLEARAAYAERDTAPPGRSSTR